MEFVGGRGISLFKHSLVHSWFNFFSVTWMMMVILLCHFPPAYVFYWFLFSRFHRIPCMNEFLSRCWIYSFQRRMANRIVLNDNRLTFHSCSALFQRRRKSRLSLFLMLPRFLHSFIDWRQKTARRLANVSLGACPLTNILLSPPLKGKEYYFANQSSSPSLDLHVITIISARPIWHPNLNLLPSLQHNSPASFHCIYSPPTLCRDHGDRHFDFPADSTPPSSFYRTFKRCRLCTPLNTTDWYDIEHDVSTEIFPPCFNINRFTRCCYSYEKEYKSPENPRFIETRNFCFHFFFRFRFFTTTWIGFHS